MKKHLLLATLLLTVIAIFTACKKDASIDPTVPVVLEPFDEEPVLDHWGKNIILPAHEAFNTTTKTLHQQAQAFVDYPTPSSLKSVRAAWLESYLAWQNVPLIFPYGWGHDRTEFEEDISISQSYFFLANGYPTYENQIEILIKSGNFNGTTSGSLGLPTLEYMLYGLADTDSDILANYTSVFLDSRNKKKYLLHLTSTLQSQSDAFFDRFKDKLFVKDTHQMVEACLKQLITEYVSSFYENEIKNQKVYYSSCDHTAYPNCEAKPMKHFLEGRYSKIYSKMLLLEALNTAQDLYNGVPFGGSFEDRRNSMYQYLDHLGTQKKGKKLCDLINDQFNKTRTEIDKLDDDLGSEVENRIDLMINVYEHLEQNNTFLKIDMLTAMGIETKQNTRYYCR